MNKFISTILILLFLIVVFSTTISSAQSVGMSPNSNCIKAQSEVTFFIVGEEPFCSSPIVDEERSWHIHGGREGEDYIIVNYEVSADPISYHSVKVKFLTVRDYSVEVFLRCHDSGGGTTVSLDDLNVYPDVPTTVSITSNGTTFCSDPTPFTFTAHPTNEGRDPEYQWKINGVVEEINSNYDGDTFEPRLSILDDGDVITVTMISDIACVQEVTSNSITVTKESAISALPSQQLEFCDFELAIVSIPVYSSQHTYNWYDNDGVFLGKGKTDFFSGGRFSLGILKEGIYHYSAELIDSYGCPTRDRTPVTVLISSNCENELHWIESISYDNEGTIGHTKSYFDQSGKLLQSQGKNLTTNQILTSQSIEDEYGRAVVGTLSAPINKTDFQYKHWFATNASGGLYDHENLGQAFGNTEAGTVGWYYSDNNTMEDNVPVTGFPYSQMEYYTDGTGEVKKSGGPGEVHKLGMGHETLSGTFPVFAELDDYLDRRNVALPDIVHDGSLVNEGVQSIARDQNGKRGANENFSIGITDKEGKVVMTARSGGSASADHVLAVSNSIIANVDATSVNYRPMVYFYLLTPQAVSIATNGTTTYTIEDIITGQTFTPSGNWPVGFYRVLVSEGEVNINYINYYLDVTYQFYDDAGRLMSSISPNGYKQWITNTNPATNYPTIDKTTYKYNFRGWLLEMTEPDAGTTKYQYRKDGKIRYSQNAQQALDEVNNPGKGRFSYTNYDYLGRPIESGEYKGTTQTFASVKASVEFADQITFETADKKDWVKTYYESAYSDALDLPTGAGSEWKSQDFLRGAVSWSENANMKSIYSYDELGRVKWMAQKSPHLALANRTFVVRYEYDFLGNVLKVHNLAYQKVGSNVNLAEQFYHHYEYDADKRLSKAYTSVDGTNMKLRATYLYYLHGPLKRIELGDKLQGIDFVYNINGWLQSINHPDTDQDPGGDGNSGSHSDFRKDVFGMVLDYYQSDLSGLFVTSASGSMHNPSNIHRLPSSFQNAQAINQPLIRFQPTDEDVAHSTFKQYSAENPHYKKMISETSKNSANR